MNLFVLGARERCARLARARVATLRAAAFYAWRAGAATPGARRCRALARRIRLGVLCAESRCACLVRRVLLAWAARARWPFEIELIPACLVRGWPPRMGGLDRSQQRAIARAARAASRGRARVVAQGAPDAF